MKLSFTLIASTLVSSAAFNSAPTAFTPSARVLSRSSKSLVSLEGSRRSQKYITRSKWAEARMGESAASESGLMTNDDGLKYVKLVKGDSSAEVYLFGGVVTSYKDAEGTEFIAVRPDAKMDGSKPISGGLSHCWPQFGPGEIQQHGFARNVDWTVKSMSDSELVLEMAPSDYTKAMWDKEFLCTFSVNLEDDKLATKMLVDNKGEESFDFQAALHSYFTVSSLDKLEITGSFEGKEFLNKMAGGDDGEMQTEDRSAITISEEYDRVYTGVNDPVLKDAGTGKTLSVLNTAGYEDTVLWNPYGSEAMGYNNFVCVESAKFTPVTLEGGQSWTGDMALKPEKL
mmetsp:Transcript_32250/g.39255  ORF Transcript_32250/g.39255 Transcript_32250/m.39255 type:complete len:342 (-) Transcript_32250:274-1299(-)